MDFPLYIGPGDYCYQMCKIELTGQSFYFFEDDPYDHGKWILKESFSCVEGLIDHFEDYPDIQQDIEKCIKNT